MRVNTFLTLMAFTSTAGAQVLDVPAPGSNAQQAQVQLQARFGMSDADHDGKLTREEADGNMPWVAMNFDAIDKSKSGYVTLEQIEVYALQRQSARRDNASSLLLYR